MECEDSMKEKSAGQRKCSEDGRKGKSLWYEWNCG